MFKFNSNIVNEQTTANFVSSILGIGINIVLFITKLIIAYLIKSGSLLSDAFNNLSDSLSSIIAFLGTYVAKKPPDQTHPYGHGRSEMVASLFLSIILTYLGFELFLNNVFKINKVVEITMTKWLFVILILTILTKLGLCFLNKYLYIKHQSLILKITYLDCLSDILITSLTLCAIFLNNYFNFNLDALFACLISFFIIFNGFKLMSETIAELLGKSIDSTEIKQYILSHKRILDVHDIYVHQYAQKKYGMADVVVSCDENLVSIHHLIDEIEEYILNKYQIKFSMHVDPFNVVDEAIVQIVENIDQTIKIHDYSLNHQTKVLKLDLVFDWKLSEINEKAQKIIDEIKLLYPQYQVKITLDRDSI